MKNLLHVTLEPLQNTLSSHEKPPFGSPLAFMASLQTNGTIDIGEPLQPTLSETVDYDRFFLAEHDIYGSSRIGMRQYLPREYVYEWDVDKSAEDNMISRDSSEFTYRRPWYNNATQSLYGWSGNFRPFIYYTWQGPVYSQRILGQKRYELTNHLGNVMAVVADKVTEVPASTGIPAPSPALKRAALTAVYDYYPFGMLMPSRFYEDESDQMLPITRTAYVMHIHYITIGGISHPIDTSYDADYNYVVLKSKLDEFGKDYRFGFNGKMKDNEVAGVGNHLDYGARGRDPRLGGGWWSVDPAAKEYPGISPYVFVADNPINAIDPDGKRVYFVAGAGNDPVSQGWNYVNRFATIWKSVGITDFIRVNASHGKFGDMKFVDDYRNSEWHPVASPLGRSAIKVTDDKMLERAVNGIVEHMAKNPLPKGEQLNLVGYSYGSVLQEHVALKLIEKGYHIDNLVLIASPTEEKSDLMDELKDYQKKGKIGNIRRIDIPGDGLSNPKGVMDYLNGIKQGAVDGDKAHHFDLARPGAEADQKIQQAGQELHQQGVQ